MKIKNLILTGVVLFSMTAAKAQGPYLGLGLGFGAPACSSVLGFNSKDNSVANTYSTENVKGSYGAGFNFGGYAGYMVSENIGFELGVNYLMGSKYTFNDNGVGTLSTDDRITEASVKSLRLNPSLRIAVGDGKIRPYMRAGFSFGVMNKMTVDYSRTNTNPGGTDITVETTSFTGGTSIGMTGALGIQYQLTDKLFLYGEVTNYYANWAPTKGEVTKSTYNGSDQLGSMTTDQKQYEFVDMVDQSMNTSNSQPTKQLKSYTPMSSFGLNIGVHFGFGG